MGTLNVDAINDAAGSISALDVTKEIGIWQFVSTAAITVAGNLSVTGIAAGYDYLVQLNAFCCTTDAGIMWLRVSEDAGSSYKAGASDYSHGRHADAVADAADNQIDVNGYTAMGNDAGNHGMVEILAVNPNSSGENKLFVSNGTMETGAATPILIGVTSFGMYWGTTSAVNAMQLGWSTNYGTDTFKAQGDITVWRRRRS